MGKILSGIMGIVLVASVVGGTAFAVFSSTVKVNNVAISTGNANLEFSPDNSTWSQDFTFGVWQAQNIVPGYHDFATFYVRNNSTSDINLKLSAWLASATGDWDALKDVAEIWIGDNAGSVGSGYFKLSEWNAGVKDINLTVTHGSTLTMRIYLNIPIDAGNSISGKTLSTNWELYGTQVTP